MAGPKPLLAEFGIHHKLESCAFIENFKLFFIQVATPDQGPRFIIVEVDIPSVPCGSSLFLHFPLFFERRCLLFFGDAE